MTAWGDAIVSPRRTVASRVDVVTVDGTTLGSIPCDAVSVDFNGEQAEQWRASFRFSDPTVVPLSTSSVLDGRSGLLLRPVWRVQLPDGGGWHEVPCGTYVVEDPAFTDSGALSGTVPGLDVLALARRGGYGAFVIPVGGLTVDAALRRLFGVLVPQFPVSIEPSTVTLPPAMELWDRDPAEDWTEIAAMAGLVVRTNRLGVITARRPPSPTSVRADWQEGARCPVTELSVETKTSTIPRRVVVVSNNPDVVPPVVGEWVNPDADSQMIVTEQRIESSTVTTVEAANNLARMSGERWSRPQVNVDVTVPARPDLDYRDPIALSRHQVNLSGVYQVSGWSFELRGPDDPPGLMKVSLMTKGE